MLPEKRDSESKSPRAFKLIRSGPASAITVSSVGSIAQIVIAAVAVIGICYAAKVPLVTLLVAILVTFILAPIVDFLQRRKLPRWAGSFIAVALLVSCLYGIGYFSYSSALSFLDDLPKYSANIRRVTSGFRKRAESIEKTTETVFPETDRNTVKVRQQDGISQWISNSGITEAVMAASFIPFLVYFMLSWMEHTRNATVKLFDPEHRHDVSGTMAGIADMLRAFLVGELICGLFMAAVSTAVFWYLGLQYFYFLGFISGFLSLVPYLGVVLAMLPPLAAGVGTLEFGELLAIAALVVGLHVFTINVLFPKVIGKRLKLNPLVVTVALLAWGWLWGAMGLILAVPLTGAMKIIFDHVPSLRPVGEWMEE